MQKYLDSLLFGFHVIFHPFDGFWDLKREKRGTLKAALTFIVLTICMYTIEKQNTGFLFNTNRLEEVNVFVDIITVGLMFVLWCVSNWCLTSLMDGEGRMRDIAIYTAYAVIPLLIIQFPLVGVSHFITLEEGTFYYVFRNISYIWALALLLAGMSQTHQYSMKKTLFTTLLTLLGMMIITFIALLFFSVLNQIFVFVLSVYKEIRFR
ncbi:YIP1 family protein [Butyrivibrio sp. MC2013]|uniref:YIP1 family protein n=1 Tax=Butyrivibrio sp. MC2013 TaxID=1280686 RepID=UPI000422C9B9|nr:YIP1 family protein [Butyrivibrio sp. MC2013]